jgi:hypothetical protein
MQHNINTKGTLVSFFTLISLFFSFSFIFSLKKWRKKRVQYHRVFLSDNCNFVHVTNIPQKIFCHKGTFAYLLQTCSSCAQALCTGCDAICTEVVQFTVTIRNVLKEDTSSSCVQKHIESNWRCRFSYEKMSSNFTPLVRRGISSTEYRVTNSQSSFVLAVCSKVENSIGIPIGDLREDGNQHSQL